MKGERPSCAISPLTSAMGEAFTFAAQPRAPPDDDAIQTPFATSLASQWRSALELGSPWHALRHLFRPRLQSRAIIHHN